MKIDEKLVYLRKERKLTQAKLAEELNVSRQAISRWELGEAIPSTENLKCLSVLYQVPLDYLLNDDECEYKLAEKNNADVREPGSKGKRRARIYISVFLILSALLLIMWFSKNQITDSDEIGDLEETVVDADQIGGFDLNW